MNGALLTTREASEFLRVSRSTLYRYCERGALPHIKKNFGLRFRKEDLEKWLGQDKRKSFLAESVLEKTLTAPSHFITDMMEGGKGAMAKAKKMRLNCGFGAVYIRKTKKGNSRYYADYRDRSGSRRQKLLKNATGWHEALEGLKNMVLKEHYLECGIDPQKQQIKLKEFVDMFIENYSKVNKRSWKDDQYRLQKLVGFFGNIYLHEVTPLDIEKFKLMKLTEGRAKATVNTYLKVLKRMYNIAIDWGYAKDNPARRVKLYSEKDSLKERILSKEEEDRLLEAASAHLRPILVIALNTGMRRGEILNLKWNQIDFQKNEIRVEKTKSEKPRTVDINSYLLEKLLRLKKKSDRSQYVFINPKTGVPFTTVRRSFENACKDAGIEELRFHDLRHSFASRLIEKGVDIIRVKELLGHSSVRVTERYTHSNQKERKKAVELLCEKSTKPVKKGADLLHIRYTKKDDKDFRPVSSLFSMN